MIRRSVLALLLAFATSGSNAIAAPPPPPLKIGVTLHPYYSWVKNIAGDAAVDVRPILPGEVDVGSYQPRPEDIKRIADLDAIVINGVGHDDFVRDMIRASGNKKLLIINPNDGVPLISAVRGGNVNSHTFISFTNAIQQTYAIQRALSTLRPDLAPVFQKNATEYARRLRVIKAKAANELVNAKTTRVVTVHDGYSYLLQELGLEIAQVVEPAHGLVPSAGELQSLVKILKNDHLKIVFSEESFPEPLLRVLKESAGARVYLISHIASGPYTAEKFEREMEKNVASIIQATVKDG